METKFIFNHEITTFTDAIGINDDTRIKAREKIFFCAFSSALQRYDLYGEDDEKGICPRELKTLTGDLERVVKLATNELELYSMLIFFRQYEELAIKSFAHYKVEKDLKNDEDVVKLKILELIEHVQKLKQKEEDKEENDEEDIEMIDKMSKETMFKRIELVKKSNYNVDSYLKLLYKWSNHPFDDSSDKEITQLLNNIVNQSDDSQ
jgi:uncharacterized protein (UPF0305 family)